MSNRDCELNLFQVIKKNTLLFIISFFTPYLFLVQSPITFLISFFLFFVYLLTGSKGAISKNDILFFLFFFVISFPSLLIAQHEVSHLFYFLLSVLVFFSAKKSSREDPVLLNIIFGVSYWAFAFFSSVVYYVYRDIPEPFSGLVEGSSTNGIPSYLLVLSITYSIIYFVNKNRLPIYPCIATLLISILGIGRGSIYVSVMLLLLSIIVNFIVDFKYSQTKKILYFVFFTSIIVVLISVNFEWIYNFISMKTKALQGVNDPYRARIIWDYLSGINWWQSYVGGTYSGTVIETMYKNNPHISFIRAHAYLGFGYVMLIFLSPLFFLFKCKSTIYSCVFFSFSFLLLIRAASEPILFPTSLDYFYFFIYMIYFKGVTSNYMINKRY